MSEESTDGTSRNSEDESREHTLEREGWSAFTEEWVVENGELVLGDTREEGLCKTKNTWECTCGERFRKKRTAKEHLAEVSNGA